MKDTAFTGFEDAMIDFFWAIRFNNNREWFAEHKATYVEKIYEPMKALAREVCAGMEARYGLESLWRCSRIYRDARRPAASGALSGSYLVWCWPSRSAGR